MHVSKVQVGQTYRTIFGAFDLFVIWRVHPNVGYRVETGPKKGAQCMSDIAEFAERLRCKVPNHRNEFDPIPFRSFGPEES